MSAPVESKMKGHLKLLRFAVAGYVPTNHGLCGNAYRALDEIEQAFATFDAAGAIASPVHTCHAHCQRLECVQRREIERLRAALVDARECVDDWAAHASDYYREKDDLAGDLSRIDAALRTDEGGKA